MLYERQGLLRQRASAQRLAAARTADAAGERHLHLRFPPTARATRRSGAALVTYSSSADLPTPASPRSISARRAPTADPRQPSSAARSRCRSTSESAGSDLVRMPITAHESGTSPPARLSRHACASSLMSAFRNPGRPHRDGAATVISSQLTDQQTCQEGWSQLVDRAG